MAADDLDLYEELEVSAKASPETIEAAYRSLVKRYHPDTAKDKVAAERRIKRINAARDVLMDPAARASYDLARASWTAGRSQPKQDAGAGASRQSGPSQASPTPPPRTGRYACSKCGRQFKKASGLEWHRANFRDCQEYPVF